MQLDLTTVLYLLELCDYITSRDKWEKPLTLLKGIVAVPITGLAGTAGIIC